MYASTFSTNPGTQGANFEAPESADFYDGLLLSPAHPWDSQVEQTPEEPQFHEYYGLDLAPPAPKRLKIVFPADPSRGESASTQPAPARTGRGDISGISHIKAEKSPRVQPNLFGSRHSIGLSYEPHNDAYSTTETTSTSSTQDSTPSTPAFEMPAWLPTTRSGRPNRPPERIQETVSEQEILLEARDPRAKVTYKAPIRSPSPRKPKPSTPRRIPRATPAPSPNALNSSANSLPISSDSPKTPLKAPAPTSPSPTTPPKPKTTPVRPRRDWGMDISNIEPDDSPSRRRGRVTCIWTADDDEKLKQLITRSCSTGTGRSISWNSIASYFGSSRTATQCSERWMQFVAEENREATWTDVEDQILKEWDLVSDPNPWKQLASEMPGRTARSLSKRYELLASVGLASPKPHKPHRRTRVPAPSQQPIIDRQPPVQAPSVTALFPYSSLTEDDIELDLL